MASESPQPVNVVLALVRVFAGPVFIIGGWQLMPQSYFPGALIAYFGFVLWTIEVIHEPELLKRGYQWQVAALGSVFGLIALFTIQLVIAPAPLNISSYAMRKGEYAPETVIAGIAWNNRFTDLRVVIMNPTRRDYDDFDVGIFPEGWTYRAAILGDSADCKLLPNDGDSIIVSVNGKGGATKITEHFFGNKVDVQNNVGDIFTTLATRGGYRLKCNKFPHAFPIQIVFAMVSVDRDLLSRVTPKPDQKGMGYAELAPNRKGMTIFDLLTTRPFPTNLGLQGSYSRRGKEFTISQIISVSEGN